MIDQKTRIISPPAALSAPAASLPMVRGAPKASGKGAGWDISVLGSPTWLGLLVKLGSTRLM